MDVDATRARISKLEADIRSRRIFIFGGVVIAASPLLPFLQGKEDASLGWGSAFLIAVGIFVTAYGFFSNRSQEAERARLQAELDAVTGQQMQDAAAAAPAPQAPIRQETVVDAEEGTKCVHLRVRGRVTGVGYRFWFSRFAEKLGLTGYVENTADDCVEAVVCGPSSQVDIIAEEAAVGPRWAEPTSVDVSFAESPGVSDFQIRR